MNLKNHFLIAMPSLTATQFNQTVIYLCNHSREGTMGLIINQPIADLTVQELLNKLAIQAHNPAQGQILLNSVFNGGPVATEHGFILHTPSTPFLSSLAISKQLTLTTSLDILKTLGTSQQPESLMIALGCTSWSAGQLEQEISDNYWLVVPANLDLIFNTELPSRWYTAIQSLGFSPDNLIDQVGHA